MATYKLIQDIEAEDHILGPLTLRQFIFGMIAAFLIYCCYFVTIKGAAFLLVVLLPPTLFFGFFALPLGRDQSTEVWALAKLRFFLKPRRRVWDQSGVKELVTITAPKRTEPVLTDGLSPYEVQSRLKALAETIDSRGWAVKNVAVGSMVQPIMGGYTTDRLIDVSALPQAVPEDDISRDDVLDMNTSQVAHQFDAMISQSEQAHRQQLMQKMNSPEPAAQAQSGYWFMNQPAAAPVTPAAAKSTDPEILSLANNNDLNIATLARQAAQNGSGGSYGSVAESQPVQAPAPTAAVPVEPPKPVATIPRVPAAGSAPRPFAASSASTPALAAPISTTPVSDTLSNESDNQTGRADKDSGPDSKEVTISLH